MARFLVHDKKNCPLVVVQLGSKLKSNHILCQVALKLTYSLRVHLI
jgi:hypothetical protein